MRAACHAAGSGHLVEAIERFEIAGAAPGRVRAGESAARGRGALDVRDDLKIGLLSGNFDTSTVSRLRDAAAGLKSTSGDPGLDAVLSEIELRVEVELAKAGQFRVF